MSTHAFKELPSQLQQGKVIQEILGITPEQMGDYLSFVYELKDEKRYSDAADVLFLLSILNPFVAEVWHQRGICEHAIENHDESLYAFTMAISLEPYESRHYMELVASLIEQEHVLEAIDFIDLMQGTLSQVNPEDPSLVLASEIKQMLMEKNSHG